jgi:plasmid stability protein
MAVLNVKNLPDGLYRKLKARARAHHRSVAQELTHLLEELLEQPEPRSLLELRGLGKTTAPAADAARRVAAERASWD